MDYTDINGALLQLAIIKDKARSLIALSDANSASRLSDDDAVTTMGDLGTEISDAVTALAALQPVVIP
jgi:hypothetical protein